MFFRNLTIFRFPTSLNFDGLADALAELPLKPVGPQELSSRGFVSPFGRDSDVMSHRIGDAIWFTVGGEERLLPAAVVNDLLAKKIAEVEQQEGRKIGGRTRRRIKDDLVFELLPKAFVKPSRTDAMLDLAHGILVVDSSSRKAAESVVSEIRQALGSFPALPLNAEVAPRSILTGWIAGEPLPVGLSLGDECELRDATDGGACWKGARTELGGDEVAKHLETGSQASRVAVILDEHVSFVLGEDLVLRKFRMLDGAVESLANASHDDLRSELDARFALMAGEVKRTFAVLEKALTLSKAEA